MVDPALSVIKNTPVKNITFLWFRAQFKADHDQKDELDRGHAVITTVANLDQYLYTHGPMIESQWERIEPVLQKIAPPDRLIDYGCGQGLAGLLINDVTGGRLLAAIDDIVLIEPSQVGLDRAAALYKRLVPNAGIERVCKRFDDVVDRDIPDVPSEHTMHVFSNSLDLEGFDAMRLVQLALRPGRHTFLAVSQDRDFRGGTPKIRSTKEAVEVLVKRSNWLLHQSTLNGFQCTNPSRSEGVVWCCELEIP